MSKFAQLMIWRDYLLCLIGLIAVIYFIVKIYKLIVYKQNLFSDKKVSKDVKESMKKNPKPYNLLGIGCYIVIAIYCITINILVLPDLFNFLNNKYIPDECIARAIDEKDSYEFGIDYLNENNEFIEFAYYGDPVNLNAKIKENYYKYLKIGTIVEVKQQ